MPGRRSSAGRARGVRRQSASQIQWRQASATEVAETGGLEITGGNGYIDPQKAIDKLKKHGRGLWGMQAFVALGMSAIAVITGEKFENLSATWSRFRVYHEISRLDLTAAVFVHLCTRFKSVQLLVHITRLNKSLKTYNARH